MKAKSINTSTFYLTVGGFPCPGCITTTTTIPATVKYNADNKTAVLNPSAALAANTTYTATVEGTGDGDMKAVKDRGGTPLATDYTFSFTTGSGPPPCDIC
jgi:Bacterial Ig-like domain